jgi:hypothetical protein
METPDLDALEQTLRAAGAAFVSPGIVDMPDDATSSGEASCQTSLGRTRAVRSAAALERADQANNRGLA